MCCLSVLWCMYDPGCHVPFLARDPFVVEFLLLTLSILWIFRCKEKSPKGLSEYWGYSLGIALKYIKDGSVWYVLELIFSDMSASSQLAPFRGNLVSNQCVLSPSNWRKASCPVQARGNNNNSVYTDVWNTKQQQRNGQYYPKECFRFYLQV